MNKVFTRLTQFFLGLFALSVLAVAVYQLAWVLPAKRCEEHGKWWDPYERVCARPVLISDITGRIIQDKQAEAEALKAMGKPPRPAAAAAATQSGTGGAR